ncbi:MAG: hypothetical protein WCR56_01840 [Bacilli bacterium]|jgi:hypothetical protein
MEDKKEKEPVIAQIDNQTNKKTHKKMTPATKKSIIVSCVFAVCFATIGGFGGYFLFGMLHPTGTNAYNGVNYGKVPTTIEVNFAIDKGTLTADYKDTAYSLINYCLSSFSQKQYSLIIGKGSVVSSGVTQTIESGTFATPTETFRQNISSSSFVHTADRNYDQYDGKVVAYNCQTADDWTSNPTSSELTYDQYIQTYGKLIRPYYYATTQDYSSDYPITDRYLSYDYATYKASSDSTKHLVNDVIIYDIGPNTVSSSTIEENDAGYLLTAVLVPNKATFKYSVQMKATGGLGTYPSFSASTISFQVDKELNLVSSTFTDSYTVNVKGILNSTAEATFTQYYFQGSTPTFNDVEVKIPEIGDTDFVGYKLFPTA